MVVYIDVVYIENFIVNFFLLYITSKTLKNKINCKYIAIASALGSTYIFTMLIDELKIFTIMPFKLIVAILMTLISFRKKDIRFYIKSTIIFILYSMLIAGICVYMQFSQNTKDFFSSTINNFSYKKLLISIIIIYLIIDRIVVYVKSRGAISSLIYKVEILSNNKKVIINAFLDTGNELREPITNLPVIIVENKFFGDYTYDKNNTYYIPYKVINGDNGKLIGFKPDCVYIYNHGKSEEKQAIIAKCEGKLSNNNDYNALLSRGVLY